jgi:hypothetical protein
MAARGFLGAGDLYLAIQVSGVFPEYVGPFECRKLEVKPNVTVKEMTSKGKTTYGQVIETVAVQQPADLTVELSEVAKDTLTIALLGTTSAITQASGSVTDEAITAKLGKWIVLSKAQVSGIVVTNSAATVTYVNGVDYIVNAEMGWVKALTGGAITESQSLKVDFSHAAITGTLIKGSTQAQIRARFLLDGVNFADDTPCIVTIHEAVIAADSAFDFLADDFNAVSLPGRMKTPTGFTEPYTVALRDAAV